MYILNYIYVCAYYIYIILYTHTHTHSLKDTLSLGENGIW